MLDATSPALILAPMEGVTDAPMRALQGATGAFTFAVTEFLRVAHAVPPRHVFFRHVPELAAGCRTPTGLPVQVQLLGGDPALMAAAAALACDYGATAIDLNFGCPARTVNRHDGGASLLRDPARLRAIVAAVRAAVPAAVPVSAKLRLGWDCTTAIDENAAMAAEGGASWLTVHARTRTQGYAPPVDWPRVGRVRERLGIPVVANGDIWSVNDFRRCRDATGCRHFMLGRGALADPRLAPRVAAELGLAVRAPEAVVDWPDQLTRLAEWSRRVGGQGPDKTVHKMKQWLSLAAKFGGFMHFDAVKRATSAEELLTNLRAAQRRGSRRFAEASRVQRHTCEAPPVEAVSGH
jgi:tRNA-dihydrouridine synthase C